MSSLGSKRAALLSGNRIHPGAVAWSNAVVVAGGTVSYLQLSLVSALRKAFDAGVVTLDFALLRKAENVTQASIDLIGLRTVLPVSAPVFTAQRGVTYNGTSNYDDSTFDASLHARYLTGSNMQVDTWEAADVNAGTNSMGVVVSTNVRIEYIPRTSGGQGLGNLNSDNITGITNASSLGLNSVYRNGSIFGFYKNDTSLGTAVPATSGTVLPSGTLFIGARRNGASADRFRASTHLWDAWGPAKTLPQQVAYYAALNAYMSAVIPDIVVSAVAFGPYPVGNDTTGTGTAAAPYLTIGKALTVLQPGGKILLNGDTAAPTGYVHTGLIQLTSSVTIQAINALGAYIASTDTSRSVYIAPTVGATINFVDMIIDASKNTAGAVGRCVDFTSQSVLYRVNFTGCKFLGWTLAALYAPSAACKAYVTLTGCTGTGDTMQSFIDMQGITEGGLSVSGGTVTLTNQNLQSHGVILYSAAALGVTASVVNLNYDMTTNVTANATVNGIQIINVAGAVIDGGTHRVTCPAGLTQSYLDTIRTNGAGNATELPIDGSIIRNVTANPFGNGGIAIAFGYEGGCDRTKQVGCLQQDNVVVGNAAFVAAGGHAHFARDTTNGIIRRPTGNTHGISVVDKLNTGLTVDSTTVSNASSSYGLVKGSTGSSWTTFSATAGATYAGTMIHVEDDDVSGTHSTGISFTGLALTVNGASGVVLIQVDASNTATFTGVNDYHLTSGSVAAPPWSYQGTLYSTFPAWRAAHDTGATSNIP